jgi:hypothetical protein
MKERLSLDQYIEKYGTRKAARHIVDMFVKRKSDGMISLEELPDVPEIVDVVDEMEEYLKSGGRDKERIKEIGSQIDNDFLESVIFS